MTLDNMSVRAIRLVYLHGVSAVQEKVTRLLQDDVHNKFITEESSLKAETLRSQK